MYVETSQYFRQEIAFLFQGKVRVIWIPKWSFSSSCFIAGDSHLKTIFLYAVALREKYPNTELFLVRNILYSDWINLTPKISIFSPNTGKYGPEINPYLDTFHAVDLAKKWGSLVIFSCLSYRRLQVVLDVISS